MLHRTIRLLVALTVALLATPHLRAEAASPVPPFPADGVAASGVPDDFEGLRAFLDGFESQIGARYHVAMVALADPHDRPGGQHAGAAVGYVDRVAEAWRAKLDADRSIVIVLAKENRGIAIHPGALWTGLGFEKGAIKRVINGSPFVRYAKAGAFDEAIERLIESVDWHLKLKLDERSQAVAHTEAAIRELLQRVETFTAQRLGEQPFDVSAAAEHARAARSELATARGHLRNEDLANARRQLANATQTLRAAERGFLASQERHRENERMRASAPKKFGDLQARRDAYVKLRDGKPYDTAHLARDLESIDGALEDAYERLRQEDFVAADAGAVRVHHALVQAGAHLARADRDHVYRTQTLPLMIGTAAAIAIAVLLLLLHLAKRRRQDKLEELLASWKGQLENAATRLLALENEHPLLFGSDDLASRFEGRTAEVFQEVGRGVNDLFLGFAAARELVARAEDLGARAPAFRWALLEVAIATLTETPLEVGRETVTEHRLFLPEVRVVERTPNELRGLLESAYKDVRTAAEDLERRMTELPRTLHAIGAELGETDDAIGSLRERGVDMSEFASVHEALAEEREAVRTRAAVDPVEQYDRAGELREKCATLAARVRRLLGARDELDNALADLTATEKRIAALRADGVRLTEPGFEPDAMIAHARRLERAAMAAAQGGDDTLAEKRALLASKTTCEVRELVDQTLAVREGAAERIDGLRSRRAALLERLPERRDRLFELRGEHADAALRPALDNVEEAEEALAFSARCADEAEQACAEAEQRYLAGRELMARAGMALDQIDALYEEIDAKAKELVLARRAAEQGLAAAEASLQAASKLRADGDRFATRQTIAALDCLTEAAEAERAAQAAARPNWLERSAHTASLNGSAAEARERADQEHAAFRAAERRRPEVLALVDAVGRELASSSDDRGPANQLHDAARRRLSDVEQERRDEHPDWIEVRELLERADREAKEARQRAAKDRAAAEEARSAIARAASAISSADTYYGHGVSADLDSAEAALSRARSALRLQQYEEAEGLAREAREEADSAESSARARVRSKKRMAAERAAAAARTAAAATSSRSWGSSSSSSWGSSSSSSSSFGSSFGSSSGGSSFSSSSGGSSFGSSSGGSSW